MTTLSKSKNVKNIDSTLIHVYILQCISIITLGLMFGQLTHDSMYYLAMAQSIIDHHSLYVGGNFIAIWPFGYPALIAITSKVLGISVFLGSKFLSVILVSIGFVVLQLRFKHTAKYYCFVFSMPSLLAIFTNTWSEAPFIVGLLILTIATEAFLKKGKVVYIYIIFISSFFVFSTRYIGLFSFLATGLLSLLFIFKGERSRFSPLLIASSLGILLCKVYLHFNYLMTGYESGSPRTPALEGNIALFKRLIEAHIGSLSGTLYYPLSEPNWKPALVKYIILGLPHFFCITCSLYVFCTEIRNIKLGNKEYDFWKVSFFYGLSYWITIVVMRWKYRFEGYNYRLLAPAFFLVILGIIRIFDINYNPRKKCHIILKRTWTYSSIICILIFDRSFITHILSNKPVRYKDKTEIVKNRLSSIPLNSHLIFFADDGFDTLMSIYMRPDLKMSILYADARITELNRAFIKNISNADKKYLAIPNLPLKFITNTIYPNELIMTIKTHKAGDIVELANRPIMRK